MKADRLSDFGCEFVRCLRWLRRRHYVAVRVKIVPRAVLHADYSEAYRQGGRILGDCNWQRPRMIRVCESFDSYSQVVDTLIHEWAHAKTATSGHNKYFWRWYRRLKREWEAARRGSRQLAVV